ncbi:MAG: endonuclease/exonuclease/phosphatase family protein [Dietzia sp.]
MTSRETDSVPGRGEDGRPVIGPVSAPALHVMSWNVRRPVPDVLTRAADRWRHRAPRVRVLLASERPTVLCAQEVVAEQVAVILDGLGPGYSVVGRGRSADGGGEACPVFFDSRRLELVDWEQTALSATPERAGSVSWGNLFPRVLVQAHLRDRATGHEVLVVNTHLDPLSARSRLRSVRAVLDAVTGRGLPAVVTGDLNAGPASGTVRALLEDGMLADSWEAARTRRTDRWGTYAGYRPPRRGGDRIDWILTTGGLTVTDAAIHASPHLGGWPSDHLPVQAVVRHGVGGPGGHNGTGADGRDEGGAGPT